MPSSKKPAFTDVDGVKVYAELVDIEGHLRLKLVDENDNKILLLNFYDSKQLSAACDMFLSQRYGAHFAQIDGNISMEDRKELFEEELHQVEDELKDQAEADKTKHAAEGH